MKYCSHTNCSRSGQLLDGGEFYWNPSQNGYSSWCKVCISTRKKDAIESRKLAGLCSRLSCSNTVTEGQGACDEHNAVRRAARIANPALHRATDRRAHFKLKMDAFNAYGGPKCTCCNESEIKFLTIDHINNNGASHRKEITAGKNKNHKGSGYKLYQWLRKNDYPPGFRVLCFNCNSVRGAYGFCPHELQSNIGTMGMSAGLLF